MLKKFSAKKNFGEKFIEKADFLDRDLGFLTQNNTDSAFKAAQRIVKMTSPEDKIVIFERAPYFVGRAIEKWMAHAEKNWDLIFSYLLVRQILWQ
ncbi:hypothetical protein CI610_00822 [invertebrate metagenome]|uniref:Uncharacterized protein n=1 Tax=invertebrate metagenome TaxID=1711999 RepID=A0A2H9TAJ7_9ZZZZ